MKLEVAASRAAAAGASPHGNRVLVYLSNAKDSQRVDALLEGAGVGCKLCESLREMRVELEEGAGAVLLAEESLYSEQADTVRAVLGSQPSWSDLPMIVLARNDSWATARPTLGNIMLIERPIRMRMLLSAVQVALRARGRQYELRDQLEEQKATADMLRYSEQRLRFALEVGQLGAWQHNLASGKIEGTGQWKAHFGFSSEEDLTFELLKSRAHPDDRSRLNEAISRATTANGDFEIEYRVVWPNESQHWVFARGQVVVDEAGRPARMIGVTLDITERKHIEEELRDIARRKDAFLATLAHELRNPLAPIRNGLQLLRLSLGDPKRLDETVGMMERQVMQMVRLIDDLLDVSRINRGKIDLRKSRVELNSLVQQALETCRPTVEASRHRLSVYLPSEPVTLDADAVRMIQVFCNLLNNAAKYTVPGGSIEFRAERRGGWVAVCVRDSGIGIEPAMLDRVFDLFVQVDNSGTNIGGLGIGLTLVKNLVELHGGSVRARSDGLGKGSEFEVLLPIAVDAESAGENPPAAGVAASSRRGSPALKFGLRVLVVDDNRDSARSLGRVLEYMGNDVRVVHDGPSALVEARRHRPHLMLLDLGMPGMSGYDVAVELRRDPEFDDLNLVALTGWGQAEDREKTREAGFNNHLVKPLEASSLVEVLTRIKNDQPSSSSPKG